MDKEIIKKYTGFKVLITTKQGSKFTIIIPEFEGNSFSTKDKFNKPVALDCEDIASIQEPKEENNGTVDT